MVIVYRLISYVSYQHGKEMYEIRRKTLLHMCFSYLKQKLSDPKYLSSPYDQPRCPYGPRSGKFEFLTSKVKSH